MKMLFSKQWKNVRRLNEQGFTMLEMLFSFTVFCLVISLLPPLFAIIFSNGSQQLAKNALQMLEWEHFICQLKKEVQAAENVEVINGSLLLSREEQVISFHQYQLLLRRQVDWRGHEVVLQNVEKSNFSKEDGYLTLTVLDTFGNSYFAKIFPFIPFFESEGMLLE